MYDLQTRARLDVGLAHAVPGSRLELHCRGGNLIEVGGGRVGVPAICQVRSALAETGSVESVFFAAHLRSIVVSGSLFGCGADLYGRNTLRGTERWFATTLPVCVTSRVLESTTSEGDGWANFEAHLRPDPLTNVTTVRVAPISDVPDDELQKAAIDVYAACLAEEVITTSLLSTDQH